MFPVCFVTYESGCTLYTKAFIATAACIGDNQSIRSQHWQGQNLARFFFRKKYWAVLGTLHLLGGILALFIRFERKSQKFYRETWCGGRYLECGGSYYCTSKREEMEE